MARASKSGVETPFSMRSTQHSTDLSYNQIARVLTEITSQAVGRSVPTPINTSEFVSVANILLQCNFDQISNSISNTLSKTIFSTRPAYSEFSLVQVDNIRYGNHVRKLNALDSDFEDNEEWKLADGQSIDMFKVLKPKILQTNLYGGVTYQKHYTIYRDQLNESLTGIDQFGSYLTMIATENSNRITLAKDSLARSLVGNHIGAIYASDNEYQVVKVLTEYNQLTGQTLNVTTVFAPDNFQPFIRWLFARMAEAQRMMSKQSDLYKFKITGKALTRHSDYQYQRILMAAKFMEMINAYVKSVTFHPDRLSLAKYEPISYWQSPQNPQLVDVEPVSITAAGEPTKIAGQTISNVIGIIFDVEAMGVTWVNEWSGMTPFNVAGGYTNWYHHFTGRYWSDLTENAIIFVLE